MAFSQGVQQVGYSHLRSNEDRHRAQSIHRVLLECQGEATMLTQRGTGASDRGPGSKE